MANLHNDYITITFAIFNHGFENESKSINNIFVRRLKQPILVSIKIPFRSDKGQQESIGTKMLYFC